MTDSKRRSGILVILSAILLVAAFAASLFLALLSIGAGHGEIKSSNVSPDGLVSAGAPRSQLALKQMFEAMSCVRSNGNRRVYEPITEEYLTAVEESVKNGESPTLSVEEILYIISDSVACADKYDGVKLHGIGTLIFQRVDDGAPPHLAALEKSEKIFEIILYRVKSLCAPEAIEIEGDTVRYYPDAVSGRSPGRMFVFSGMTDEKNTANIVFYPGDGQQIALYPSPKVSDECNTKYMLQSGEELSPRDKEILESAGYKADRCRNVTPRNWQGLTDCKAVVSAGRIIIVDPTSGAAIDSSPENMRTVSMAIGDNDRDGAYELYFTAFDEEKGIAVEYAPGGVGITVLAEREFCMGAYECLEGNGVSFFRVEQIESGQYLNLLKRSGEALKTNEK